METSRGLEYLKKYSIVEGGYLIFAMLETGDAESKALPPKNGPAECRPAGILDR